MAFLYSNIHYSFFWWILWLFFHTGTHEKWMVLTLLCAPHSGANHATAAAVVFVSLKRRCCSSRQNWIGCTTIWNKNGLELFKIVRARYGQLVHPLFSVAGSIRNLSRSSQKISGKPHLTKQIINRNRKLPTVVVKLLPFLCSTQIQITILRRMAS